MSAFRTIALAAVAAVALAGSAQAQRINGTPGNQAVAGQRAHSRGHRGKLAAFKNLNLTDAQKAQIKAIHAKYKSQMKESREQAKSFMEAARAARQKGDTAGFRSNREKARQALSGVRTQEMNEIQAVLTPEQREKAKANMARREEKGERHGGKGHMWRGNKPVKKGNL